MLTLGSLKSPGQRGCRKGPRVDDGLMTSHQTSRGRIVPKYVPIAKCKWRVLFRLENPSQFNECNSLDRVIPKSRRCCGNRTERPKGFCRIPVVFPQVVPLLGNSSIALVRARPVERHPAPKSSWRRSVLQSMAPVHHGLLIVPAAIPETFRAQAECWPSP